MVGCRCDRVLTVLLPVSFLMRVPTAISCPGYTLPLQSDRTVYRSVPRCTLTCRPYLLFYRSLYLNTCTFVYPVYSLYLMYLCTFSIFVLLYLRVLSVLRVLVYLVYAPFVLSCAPLLCTFPQSYKPAYFLSKDSVFPRKGYLASLGLFHKRAFAVVCFTPARAAILPLGATAPWEPLMHFFLIRCTQLTNWQFEFYPSLPALRHLKDLPIRGSELTKRAY